MDAPGIVLPAPPVPRYSDEELVRRAVVNARRPDRAGGVLRWEAVKNSFGCGSTVAVELCWRFNLNPNEEV